MHPQDITIPEEWRPVVGYEGWYSVSSLGRIRRDMPGRRTSPGRICKLSLSKAGYLCVGVCKGSHASLHRYRVHQLVALAFFGPGPEGCGINHINGNKADNRPENLEWMTPAANSAHGARMGLMATGERQHLAKLNEAAVRDIRASSLTMDQLGERYGVWPTTIAAVKHHKTWRHVS